MMLYPPMADLVDKVGSSYALVNLVAKRARDISAEAERNAEPLTKKAVSAAIDEVYTGKLTIGSGESAGPAAFELTPELEGAIFREAEQYRWDSGAAGEEY